MRVMKVNQNPFSLCLSAQFVIVMLVSDYHHPIDLPLLLVSCLHMHGLQSLL
jgi:hypothetical protein